MKKLFLIIISILIILNSFPHSRAAVGIGMGPSRLSLEATIGESYSFDIVVFNPGDYDVKARLNVDCKTCLSDFTIFGWKIAEVEEEYQQFFRFDPDDVYIQNHTTFDSGEVHIKVYVTPSIWIRKNLIFTTPESVNFLVRGVNPKYQGEFRIPYYTLLIDEKNIKAQIAASSYWSTFGEMGTKAAVGAPLNLHITGMPFGSLVILIVMFLLIFSVVFIIIYRKTTFLRRRLGKIREKFRRKK